jgi:hypothetical protein
MFLQAQGHKLKVNSIRPSDTIFSVPNNFTQNFLNYSESPCKCWDGLHTVCVICKFVLKEGQIYTGEGLGELISPPFLSY